MKKRDKARANGLVSSGRPADRERCPRVTADGSGDDELILGHRHSEWTGFAPHIEEDVAFSSIAQDEIGHAAALYGLLAMRSGGDADGLALGRDVSEYRNAVLCERPNRDWAYTLARHWVYDTADAIRLEALSDTADEDLRALVTKMRREERYHLIHADTWIERDRRRARRGTHEARGRARRGLRGSPGSVRAYRARGEGGVRRPPSGSLVRTGARGSASKRRTSSRSSECRRKYSRSDE